jgi:DNA polymerase I-like protein with 3'-5' exonuclease and polymerase domains
VLDGTPYWKEPGTLAAQALYATSWPEVPERLRPWLYCGLDAYYTGLLWDAEQALLEALGMTALYRRIVAPAGLVLSKLESRGMLIDREMQDHLYAEAEQHIWELSEKVQQFAQQLYQERLQYVQSAVGTVTSALIACAAHPDYRGATKRSKDACCAAVYEANKPYRAKMRAGSAKLKSLGETFKIGSDAHWRWLLFVALKLKPVSVTKKRREPQVDDESIEKLARKHPTLEVLKWRVAIQHERHRLSGPLSLEADAAGRVHFGYNLHKAAGRITSGADAEDADKVRHAAGNAQNLADKDRRIFVSPVGHKLVQADWSQAEMRVEAWLAGETAMLQAWRDGADIHSLNALDIAAALGRTEVTLANVRTATFTFMGDQRPFRDAGKRLGLGLIYGMGPLKMSRLYGIPLPACERIVVAFFDRWQRIHEFQQAVVQDAEQSRVLVNAFSRRVPVQMKWEDRSGRYVAENREALLAFHSQTAVSDMIKAVLPDAEALYEGALDTTTHDSLRFTLPDASVEEAIPRIRIVMEREWPELGTIPGFDRFWCPADIAVGRNWGKWHSTDNPNGLKEVV